MMIAIRLALASFLLAVPHLASAQEPHVLKHDGWVAAVAFAPDGKTLASAGADNVVRLWEVGTWKPKDVLKGHSDCVCAVAFWPSNAQPRKLISGSLDGTILLWGQKKQKLATFGKIKLRGPCLAVTYGGERFSDHVYGSMNGTVSWRLGTNASSASKHKSWVNGLASREDGLLASASSDGTVALSRFKQFSQTDWVSLEGGAGEVRCVAFSPDGKTLAAGNRYGTVRIWDVASRKEIKTITGHMGEVWAIAFSPDRKTLAAVDTEWKKPSKIKLYDTTTWKERGSLPCPGEILCLAYSPNGDWLAAGSWDKTVRLFPMKGEVK